jgi:pimeloyl-ACP methyl ester carboxylesterase
MPARPHTFGGMDYETGSVRSLDGTPIGYRRLGQGPAVLVLHGGMQAAQDFMRLARYLAADFTVCAVDRRGRGLSGPHGDAFSIRREVEDVQALAAQTGATRIFGLSSGALVSLRSALETPALERVALYEPPLSVHGSVDLNFLPRFERELDEGRVGAAVVTVLKGLRVDPVFERLPRFALAPAVAVVTRLQRSVPPGDVRMADLVPTQRYDLRLVQELADTLADYRSVKADVLLLGGSKSPAFLTTTLDALEGTLPHVQRITFAGLGHGGPDDGGDPERVGAALRAFFTS